MTYILHSHVVLSHWPRFPDDSSSPAPSAEEHSNPVEALTSVCACNTYLPQHTRTHTTPQRRVASQRAEQQSASIQQASLSSAHGGCAARASLVLAVVVVVATLIVALTLTSGKSPMLVQVIPSELSSKVLPHEPLCCKQNCTHGAVKLSAPAVLQ